MTSPRLLIVHSPCPELREIVQILRSFSHLVDIVPSLSALPEEARYDLLFVNVDELPQDAQARLARMRSEGQQVVLLSVNTCEGRLETLLETHLLTHLVGRGERCLNADLVVTTSKLLTRELFGIEKYFPWGVRSSVFQLGHSSETGRLLGEAKSYARSVGAHPHLVELFCNVADELTSNAFYNAPVDAEGRRRYAHVNRTTHVGLEPGEEVKVQLISDGERLGLSVTDPFGSLTSEEIFRYLARCFHGGANQVENKAGGAGLGLYQVFNSVSHLAVSSSPGEKTEIIGLLDIRGSYRDFRKLSKSFNLFVEPPPMKASGEAPHEP